MTSPRHEQAADVGRERAGRRGGGPPEPPTGSRWHGLLLLLALFFGSLGVAALAAPAAYHAVHAWAEGSTSRLAAYLAEKDLPRYFDRLRWLVVLAGLPWLCRRTGLASRPALGLAAVPGRGRQLAAGAAAGLATILLIAAGQLTGGGATWRGAATGRVLEIVALAALSGALLGLVEEVLFRGVVFRLFLRPLAPLLALPATATFYALVHFQRVPSDAWPDDAPVTVAAGFAVAAGNLRNMVSSIDPLLFVALFLAGCILCALVLRIGGTLWAAIGLHGGWVAGALCHRRLLAFEAPSPWWGGKALVDGVVPLALLAVMLAALVVGLPRGRR